MGTGWGGWEGGGGGRGAAVTVAISLASTSDHCVAVVASLVAGCRCGR
jgi:hypothetical protein